MAARKPAITSSASFDSRLEDGLVGIEENAVEHDAPVEQQAIGDRLGGDEAGLHLRHFDNFDLVAQLRDKDRDIDVLAVL